jgi:predicted membrane protein
MLALSPLLWMQRALLLLIALVMLLVTFELIRKRRLREEYAVLWVCTGVMVLLFAVIPDALFVVAGWLHLEPVVLLTFLFLMFLAAIVLHYSAVITKISDREKGLAQEMGFLKEEMERLRAQLKETERTQVEPKPKPPSLRT